MPKNQVKYPTARQLPSGSWFCRVRVNGQDISITKPTEKEAVAEAMAIKEGIIEARKAPKKKTVTAAIDDYIEARRNILSPSTIRGYKIIQDHRFRPMMQKDIYSITQEQWQRAVNLEAKAITAKTLKNSWGFISSVIAETTGQHITVRLPQVIRAERPWLTPEQIPVFVEAIKGDIAEVPALLALSSLRRSELLDLRWDDIDMDNGTIRVSGSAVHDEDGQLIHRAENKNTTSQRIVPMIQPLKDALDRTEQRGEYVVQLSPNTIFRHINQACESNGLPKVGVHGLRHSFASLAYYLNMPEKVAMEIGGWANDQTMHKIYTHISQSQVTTAAQAFTDFFAPEKAKNGNENGNA